MSKLLATSALAAALVAAVTPAFAAEKCAPGESRFMVRARVLNVQPQHNTTFTSLNGKALASDAYTGEVDGTYFFTNNIAAELIAGVTHHHVRHSFGTELNLGSVWLLPPTLTVQYHFTNPILGNFKPYVGAGINYTHFYDKNKAALTSIDYKDSVGGALQAGVDYRIGKSQWYVNADVKKLFVSSDVTVNGTVKAKVNLDPTILGLGIGYRF